jgi:hypothetical protein
MPIRIARFLAPLTVLLVAALATDEAFAQRELLAPLGGKGTIAIDQLSGFHISAFGPGANGLSYAGPLGYVKQSYTRTRLLGAGEDQTNTTTIWFAPSADYFLIDSLSVGGLIEIAHTSGSLSGPDQNGAQQKKDLASLTSVAVIPRVGYLLAFGDRFGVWPRVGFGYASHHLADPFTPDTPGATDTFSGFVFDVDVGLLYRPAEPLYFRLGPEVALSLGASRSATDATKTLSGGASAVQLGGSLGIGVFLGL